MAREMSIGNRIAPSRFLLFIAVLVAGWALGISRIGVEQGLLAGFDAAALVFLIACAPLLKLRAPDLRDAAAKNDANRWLVLAISLVLSLVVLVAIAAQIGQRSSLVLEEKLLIVVTLVLVWTFGNSMYALHYAHLYYLRNDEELDCEGLLFPGVDKPGMADFAYFAFTLGVAVQTADVAITSGHIRRVVTIHTIAGFFFNLGVLALAVNVLGAG
jgi:uncharacterized membrane protein